MRLKRPEHMAHYENQKRFLSTINQFIQQFKIEIKKNRGHATNQTTTTATTILLRLTRSWHVMVNPLLENSLLENQQTVIKSMKFFFWKMENMKTSH